MQGKIAFEEHFAIEETLGETRAFAGDSGKWDEFTTEILDLGTTRLSYMDDAGIELAVPLLLARSVAQDATGLHVWIGEQEFDFGVGPPAGELRTDHASFVRLCAGRAPDRRRFALTGVREQALVLFS